MNRATSLIKEVVPLQLDRTHVVVRVRTLSEIGDLAMVMIRRYPGSLLTGFTLGALPWIIANAALLYWIPLQERDYGFFDEAARMEMMRYMAWMAILVMLQAPAAGVLTTIYLGQAVFEQRPTWRSVLRKAKRQFWTWVYVLGFRRMAIPVMIFLALRFDSPVSGFWDVFVPCCVVVAAALFRASRPFLPEILLLEECPLRSTDERMITAGRRSKSLHSPMSSDLSGRFIAVSFISFWIFLSVLYTMLFARGIASGYWDYGLIVLLLFYPASLWLVAALTVLIRLLSYLDTRIRLEGWEVELAVRAEAIRQFGEETLMRPRPPSANTSGQPTDSVPTDNAPTDGDATRRADGTTTATAGAS